MEQQVNLVSISETLTLEIAAVNACRPRLITLRLVSKLFKSRTGQQREANDIGTYFDFSLATREAPFGWSTAVHHGS